MPETKYTKDTDSEHKVKLESTLVYAVWRSGGAVCGQEASFEVGTALVGHGAPVKVTGKTVGGESLGKVKGIIEYNKFVGSFAVPEDLSPDDEAYFEVELSKNGLNGESDRIPIFPPVEVSEMKWSAEEARRGEELTLSARVKGVRNGAEVPVIIWEYDADGAHDRTVELSGAIEDGKLDLKWAYEYHEDTDEILTDEELQEYGGRYNPPEYFFTILVGEEEFGREQESGLLTFKDFVDIQVLDDLGQPRANAEYKVIFADGQETDGQLDADGKARLDDVPPGPYRVVISEED